MRVGRRFCVAVLLACPLLIASRSAEARAVCATARAAACLDSPDTSPLGSRVPLVVVHGWNRISVPAPSLEDTWSELADFFGRDSDLPTAFKGYSFSYNSNAVNVIELGRALRDVLDKMDTADPTGFGRKPIVIVAHSMGGLISRYLLQLSQLSGPNAGHAAGDRVLRLITLGTPHHGSPVANGPAVADKAGIRWGFALNRANDFLYQAGGPAWYQPNRTDLFWDNYDGLLDYDTYGSERNVFLTALNSTTAYDNKITAYAGVLSPPSSLTATCDTYCWVNTVLAGVFDLASDGVVPVSSALFYDSRGSPRVTTRYFPDYNHTQLATGKGDGELFTRLKSDLLASVPPPLPVPSVPQSVTGSAAGNTITVNWQAPATGAPITNYVVRAGTAPGGSNFFYGSVGAVTSVSATVASGTYYVSVAAQNATGYGPASTEIKVVAGVAVPAPTPTPTPTPTPHADTDASAVYYAIRSR